MVSLSSPSSYNFLKCKLNLRNFRFMLSSTEHQILLYNTFFFFFKLWFQTIIIWAIDPLKKLTMIKSYKFWNSPIYGFGKLKYWYHLSNNATILKRKMFDFLTGLICGSENSYLPVILMKSIYPQVLKKHHINMEYYHTGKISES